MNSGSIYLDYAASTPIDEQVLSAMLPFMQGKGSLGNASAMHYYGRRVQSVIESARDQVAQLLNAKPEQIIWTSGATESNNLVIKGVRSAKKIRPHIITSATEHKSVLDPCRELESAGFAITYLKPGTNGLLKITDIENAISAETVLISIMHINNETGVIQDIAAIGKLAAARNILFHVDAAQSIGKIPFDVAQLPVDLASLSAHKMYGPKGIGALFVRDSAKINLDPLLLGGGQEQGLRAGTLATHQIVGMGAACLLAQKVMEQDQEHFSFLRTQLIEELANIEEFYINGDLVHAFPGIISLGFKYIDGRELLAGIPEIAAGTGSACNSQSLEASYVLRALGVDSLINRGTIRISLGRSTTLDEIKSVAKLIKVNVNELRDRSALWKILKNFVR